MSTDNPTVTAEEINLINIEIAEILGWKWYHNPAAQYVYRWIVPPWAQPYDFWVLCIDKAIPMSVNTINSNLSSVPNYYYSLDACAEFESRLTNIEQKNYITALWKTNPFSEEAHYKMNQAYVSDRIWWGLATATAPQRCEAFLRLRNKWPVKENPIDSTNR